MTVRYCIIGTGFAGTAALWHLVRRLTGPDRAAGVPPSAVTIVTIERGPVNGPGHPYAAENVELAHRCNNEASTMGIHGNDFVDWMVQNCARLATDHPELILETHPGIDLADWRPRDDEFYPRALFGLYLRDRFREAVERARVHGVEVRTHLRTEVVDGCARDGRFSCALRRLDTGHEFTPDGFDRVLLSTGHWRPAAGDELADRAGYVASPYPPDAAKTLVADRAGPTRVFVQGMGPSGIDAVLTLADRGRFTYSADGHVTSYRPSVDDGAGGLRIVAGSRCGFFSPVRGPLAGYELRHLTEAGMRAIRRENGGRLRLAGVLELLDRDLRCATGGALGWKDVANPRDGSAAEKLANDLRCSYAGNVVHTVVLRARRLRFYSRLDAADKRVYDRLLDSHVIRTAVPMPAANAEKLLALMDAGVLTTVRLGYDAPPVAAHEDGTFRIGFEGEDGEPASFTADGVVRAVVPDFGLEHHPAPLIRNLLRRGEIVPHEEGGYVTGGLALDPRVRYRVTRRAGDALVPSPHLSAFGAPVRFWQNEHNFAGAFVEAARWVADDWLSTRDSDRVATTSSTTTATRS